MSEEDEKITFAQKYNLVGKSKPVRISERTKNLTKALHRRGKETIKRGEEYVKQEKRPFGLALK
jgi:hypothetical protein